MASETEVTKTIEEAMHALIALGDLSVVAGCHDKSQSDMWRKIGLAFERVRRFFVDESGRAHMNVAPWEPPMDLVENDESYTLRLEVAGVDKKKIGVSMEGNKTVVITGVKEKPPKTCSGEDRVLYRDIVYGEWSKVVHLPGDADTEDVSAHCENGVLTIVLGKSKSQTTTKIPVL